MRKQVDQEYPAGFGKEGTDLDRGPEETLESIYELLSDCEHILEKECSDQRMSERQEQLSVLTAQSECYRRNLIDQQMNSKCLRSRKFAALTQSEKSPTSKR